MAQWNHPVSIPNLEVKRCSADGSAAKGRVRVGRCQFFPPLVLRGVVFFVGKTDFDRKSRGWVLDHAANFG